MIGTTYDSCLFFRTEIKQIDRPLYKETMLERMRKMP